MKKIVFLVTILIAIIGFAAADYFINKPEIEITRLLPNEEAQIPAETEEDITGLLIAADTNGFGYTIEKRDRTKQLFEKFDLSGLNGIRIYRNILKEKDNSDSESSRIIIYEVQTPEAQGKLTYLGIKLKIVEQLTDSENIKDVEGYGEKSFFYNDLNNPNTAFFFSQVENNLFGFQYNKEDENSFNRIKEMINTLNLI